MRVAVMDTVFRPRFNALKVLAILATVLLWCGWAGGARAEVFLEQPLCHAVTATPAQPDTAPPFFSCEGQPVGYQHGSLWLRADLDQLAVNPDDLALLVHNSRFDRLEVAFTYEDGRIIRQAVGSGDFGTHWRTGAQVAFEAPVRDAPLKAVTMRFDRLASAHLLRMRLMSRGEASLQSTALSISVAAALTLLLMGAVFNTFLAATLRRQFPVWQAAWATSVLVWGMIWSQLNLFIVPGMAGAVSAQASTALSCLAITCAAFSAVTAIDPANLPRILRRITLAVAAGVGVLGIPLTLMRSGPINAMANTLGLMVLAVLAGVALCLGWAWRRGSPEARSFAGAWSLPMVTLGVVQFADTDAMLWGGGAQLLVLFAAAWQTLWLAAAASQTHARLRIEHDRARTAEARAHELARRDPLTGLHNRRGFTEAVAPMLKLAHAATSPIALLLLDVDLFKRINDNYGHDTGDGVLQTIAQRLSRWEGDMCQVARLGGEEFALMIAGMEGFALARFAESVRLGIAACDHGPAIEGSKVTVSIGVAKAPFQSDFRQLYRLADEALYTAKRQGRDRVVFHGQEDRETASLQTTQQASQTV
ncbi:sensor domain-containing diguanylate cyclase [Novosphingobium mangrovi (ex Huang et al. 2023)]|uniref:diguanylate cyclase n=1 Tax=Novosphingobium mangrovi (ex Huang et al. 2023) TaxID=2976432 RepID=A0ABT2I4I2_9SPHN|nr:GGDEF domain-containing protein [Novosphingobium mangrovi (ex Huang et al. 2023)]MCT2399723.1 GGDEF domain-containing protein [Novosphingobium mangrovi (ex Huang et al. 2023)]